MFSKLLFLVVILSTLVLYALPMGVSAAAPECFLSGSASYDDAVSIECNGPFNDRYPDGLQDDKCYHAFPNAITGETSINVYRGPCDDFGTEEYVQPPPASGSDGTDDPDSDSDSVEGESILEADAREAPDVPDAIRCGQNGVEISIKINGEDCIGSYDDGNTSLDGNPIIKMLKLILQVVSAGVGLVVAGMIIVAGIQYMTSQGNPQRTAAAKQRLLNAIIGLVMFIFSTAILNFLVPGGLLG